MNRNESAAFLRSDEDDVDYLRDKPMGRCPWCRSDIYADPDHIGTTIHADHSNQCQWDDEISELDNRARYQEEREANARIEEMAP